jgi:ribosomal protein S18 acetylase RimI-like enzyme
MTVRNYEPSDLDRCRALWVENVQRHRDIYEDPTIGGDAPGLEFDRHLSRVSAGRVWVAVRDDEVVGLVSLIVEDEQAEVEPVVVSSNQRGRGIGRELVDHAIAQARALDVFCLHVKPVARNREAIAFFHGAGFRTMGHVQLFMWLGPSTPGQWKPGPELFGKAFDY